MSIKQERLHIGAEILKEMNKNDELPLPNKRRLVKVMMEFYNTGDYVIETKTKRSIWVATEDYWWNNLSGICTILRRENKIFDWLPERGSFKGQWKFLNKKECDRKLKRENNELGTRTDTHNEKVKKGNDKWSLNIPQLKSIKSLPEAS